MTNTTDTTSILRDKVATAAEMWANAEYAEAKTLGAGGSCNGEACAIAEDKFRTLLDELAALAAPVAAIQPAGDEVRNAALDDAMLACSEQAAFHGGDNSTVVSCIRSIVKLKSPASSAPAQPAATAEQMNDWLTMIYDNGYALGDRLQRLACNIRLVLGGGDPVKHVIREQAEPAQPEAKGEALPCPFCGNPDPSIETTRHDLCDYIMCDGPDGCGAMISKIDAPNDDAIAAWNRRAPVPAAPADKGELPESFNLESLKEQAASWLDVFNVLQEVDPGWLNFDGRTGAQMAIDAIRKMADRARQAAIAQPSGAVLDVKYMRNLANSLRDEDNMERAGYWAIGHDAADFLDKLAAQAAPQPPSTPKFNDKDFGNIAINIRSDEPKQDGIGDEAVRKKFEALASDSYGFKRSRKGTYVNGQTARDWKWFRLGAALIDAASKERGGDALDAERYRFLRDFPWSFDLPELAQIIQLQQNAIWDSSIDAAIATTKAAK